MKASMYFNYVTRSLFRDGQRTLLAVFCVAVGVMSIVSLQLVGSMLQNSLTSNTRDTNGGDVAMTAQNPPLQQSDLAFFDGLKKDGTITNYTALTVARGSISPVASNFQLFSVEAVDPASYPVVSQPDFTSPGNSTVASLLTNNKVIVTQSFVDNYHKGLGDSFDVYIKTQAGSGQTLHVTVAGVAANTGLFAQAGSLVLISAHDYQAAAPGTTPTYGIVDVATASQAQTDAAVKAIGQQFPLAATQTVADALKAQQSSIDMMTKFLEIAGLMALLIGGVGIVNTMQVLLSRRKTEIAMLKTTGYRRIDLYLLFGMEAGLLGLVGGTIGAAAATGVSYVVRALMQNIGVTMPFTLNPWTIAGGVAIGLVTSLIFGLMPIVQAANIRPLSVIRDLPERKGVSGVALTVGLLGVLSVLFCALAIVILNGDVLLGIEAVYGTFAFLLVLSALFGLVVLGLSKLPVPERFSFKYAALAVVGLAISAAAYAALPLAGILLFAAFVLIVGMAFMPRSWKVNVKMALRNIGRQRTRTTTTLLALFIGVFTVGLVLALGADLQSQISNTITQSLTYNVVVMTSGNDTAALAGKLTTLPGLSKSRQDTFASVVPAAINGKPVQDALPTTGHSRQEGVSFLSTLEGYDLANNAPSGTIAAGRNLTAADAGTNNIVISDLLTDSGPFGMHLKPGDTVTFADPSGKNAVTATIVGVYARNAQGDHVGGVLAPRQMVATLAPAGDSATIVTYMKIDPARVTDAMNALGAVVPNATVQNMADLATYIEQLLGNILDMLVAIASLSLIAGVVIIANAVALAMLERRRELGILKSVGYTSGSVLSEIMIENGVIGAAGGTMAMVLAAGAVALVGSMFFNLAMGMSAPVAVTLVGGPALLAMLTAGLVAWRSVRVRPLEVLRYE
jgi:predicted lysophospholipase L1 biosynthesis ABC-type transport system permease subunit